MIEQAGDPAQLLELSFCREGYAAASGLLSELLLIYLRTNPLRVFRVMVWALKGRRYVMGRLADVAQADVTASPACLRTPDAGLRDWIKALRLHHWIKNSLIFFPMFLGGHVYLPAAWRSCAFAFAGMGCLASATYVLNDLIDLPYDRMHSAKRLRGFASRRIPIRAALWLIPLGILLGFGFAALAGGAVTAGLFGIYLSISFSYSLGLKRRRFLDVGMIALLLTLRLAIGVVCARVAWSAWLLAFSMLAFGSITCAKRAAEMMRTHARGGDKIPGRGYRAGDKAVVTCLGVALALAAVLLLVAYLLDAAFQAKCYGAPYFLWALPLIFAVWLGRIWQSCGRGKLHDDPLVFALRDMPSMTLAGCFGLSLAAALFL